MYTLLSSIGVPLFKKARKMQTLLTVAMITILIIWIIQLFIIKD